MAKTDAAGIVQALSAGTRFVVTSHVHPDGDAIGSVLGVAALLKAMGKEHVVCALQDPIPKLYEWLPGVDTVVDRGAINGHSFDTFVLVDANHLSRSESIAEAANGARVVVVDHHLATSVDADAHWVDSRFAATGEMIPLLFDEAAVSLDSDTALALYVALATDTGNFRFGNTTAHAHVIAARLIEAGVDVANVTDRVFDTMTKAKVVLLGRVLESIQVSAEGRVAAIHIRRKDLEETGAQPEDVEGLINYARSLEGVEVALLFRETADGVIKISSRARPGFNCADFMALFGGGGHAAAAGATVQGTLEEVEKRVLAELDAYVRRTA